MRITGIFAEKKPKKWSELKTVRIDTTRVNEQLSPIWSTFFTIYLKKQYTQLDSAHNMNNTNDAVTLT